MNKRTTPRVCKECGKSEEEVRFYRSSGLHCAKHANARKKLRDPEGRRKKLWYEKNKTPLREYALKYKYGITLEQYDTVLQQQGYGCAICGRKTGGFNQYGPLPLVVDHNHETGQIRGLLCDRCNRAIGLLQDSPTVVFNACYYLYLYLQPVTAACGG
jgi:hypothetical protein